MTSRACIVACAALVSVSTFSAPSGIAAAADAEELIREGVALRRKGEDEAALERFQRAFQINQSPRAMAQMGLAEQALGRWGVAHEHLSQALAATNDPWIKKSRAPINEALTRVNEHVGQIEILGGSEGAEVRVDGLLRGKLPLKRPIAVSTGTVTIDLTAPGFNSTQRTTVVRAQETTRESFGALSPLAVRDKAPASAPPAVAVTVIPPLSGVAAAGPAAATDASSVPTQQAAQTNADKSSQDHGGGGKPGTFRTKAKWVAWGAGTASLAVGIFGLVRQDRAGNDFSSGCAVDPAENVVVLTGSNKTVADCRDLKSQVDSNYRLEVIGLVGAGVLAATGLVLWLTEPASVEAATAALSCAPALTTGHGAWLGCRLSF